MWKQLARRFRGNPNILAYELLNEPWSGDIYADTSLLLPGQLPPPSSSPSVLPPAPVFSSLHSIHDHYSSDVGGMNLSSIIGKGLSCGAQLPKCSISPSVKL